MIQPKICKGPLSLAVAATKEVKPSSDSTPAVKSRIVVTGTSNFPMNAYFPSAGQWEPVPEYGELACTG